MEVSSGLKWLLAEVEWLGEVASASSSSSSSMLVVLEVDLSVELAWWKDKGCLRPLKSFLLEVDEAKELDGKDWSSKLLGVKQPSLEGRSAGGGGGW